MGFYDTPHFFPVFAKADFMGLAIAWPLFVLRKFSVTAITFKMPCKDAHLKKEKSFYSAVEVFTFHMVY